MRSNIQKRSIAAIILLNFLTFGLYGFYLTYVWADDINKLSGKKIREPFVTILIGIFTLSVSNIVYEIIFAYEIQKLTLKNKVEGRSRSLGEYVLTLNITANFLTLSKYLLNIRGPAAILLLFLGRGFGYWASCQVQQELNNIVDQKHCCANTQVSNK